MAKSNALSKDASIFPTCPLEINVYFRSPEENIALLFDICKDNQEDGKASIKLFFEELAKMGIRQVDSFSHFSGSSRFYRVVHVSLKLRTESSRCL